MAVRASHMARAAWLCAIVASSACSERKEEPPALASTAAKEDPCVVGGEECHRDPKPKPAKSPEITCEDPVAVYRDGKADGRACPGQLEDDGLTVVDLANDWTPRVLRGAPDAPALDYAERYVAIANEAIGEGAEWHRERHDRFFELFGIPPSFEVVAARLGDDERHRCHDAVNDEALESLEAAVNTWRPLKEQRGDRYRIDALDKQIADLKKRAEVDDVASLGAPYDAWVRLRDKLVNRRDAVIAMQEHLRCEGLLAPDEGRKGLIDSDTINAMFRYHRRHMLVTWRLDEDTSDVLIADSRELDFRTLLRSLRERVVDATGLVEDGTASGERASVVGRTIDTPVFARSHGEGGAPDLVGRATDAAAEALGWTSPSAALASLEDGLPERVALPLPPVPDYHAEHMDLSVEIDRGDVWYDFPFVPSGDRKLQPRDELPTTTLYVERDGERLALASWPTTVGGWKPERLGDGRTRLVYKESPPGERIWRDIVAAPRWFPPRSTPPRDLLRPQGGGRYAPRYDTFGPSYASAYGLVMMIHHRVDEPPGGEPFLTDQGIRSHGSVSYKSILDGYSHGCHRLHNHRAVRLAGFLLAHRRHEVRGYIDEGFHRRIYWHERHHNLHFDTRGYRYELTPPVEVDVLVGHVRGWRNSPRGPQRLTRPMMERYRTYD